MLNNWLILSDKDEVVLLDEPSDSADQGKNEGKTDGHPLTGTGM